MTEPEGWNGLTDLLVTTPKEKTEKVESVGDDDGVGVGVCVGVGLIVRASRHLVGWGGGDKTQCPSDRASGLGSPETTIDDG